VMRFLVKKIGVISLNTLQQVIRMKMYGLVMVIVVLVMLSSFLKLPFVVDSAAPGTSVLILMKSTSFGAMSLFSVGLAIAGVAVTFSDDLRQRTLYLVFSKKVSRLEYLIGKWLGVMVAVFFGLVVICLAFSIALSVRESLVVAEQLTLAEQSGVRGEALERVVFEIRAQGFQWVVLWGCLAIYAKALVVGAMTMLMVSLSRSSIFAMGATLFVILIGMFHSDAFSAMHSEEASVLTRLGASVIGVLFPDIQAYDSFDWAAVLKPDVAGLMGVLLAKTVGYVTFYLGLAWLRFSSREL